ncbi:MAG: TonB-dependent receptor [Methylobacter sp.]|nr:TonB-dependent receptor [Methylobacter sp.]
MKYLPKPLRLAGGLAVLMSGSALADEQVQFNIPEQSLSQSLLDYSKATGVKILFNENLARNLKTPKLQGSYSSEDGLRKLLGDSGLDYRFTSPKAVVVNQPKPESLSDRQLLTEAEAANKPGTTTLKAMTVKGNRDYDPNDPYNTDYKRTNAATATKTDTPIMETPMSIQVVPRTVMQDQQAVQVGDAVKNVSGVFPDFTWGGYGEGFMIRGFSSNNGGSYLDGFRWPTSRISLANMERVEVVKGAASNLYGRIEPGGMINVVTKRPQATPYYALEQRFGSYDFYQTLGDATGALNQDGSLMYRLNFEYLDKKSFRDFAFTDRVLVAPSVTWKISDRTQLDLDFMYSNEDTLEDHGVVASLTTRRPVDIPISAFLGEPSTDKSNTEIYYTGLSLKHAFSDNWAVHAKFNMQQRSALDLQHPGTPGLNETTGMLNRAFFGGDSGSDTYFGTIDVTGKFSTWGVKHDVLAGLDHYSVTGDVSSYFFGPSIFGGPIQPINIYNPVYGQSGLNLATRQKSQFLASETDWTGVYFQDQITLFDKLHILGGGRYDWATQANGSAFGVNKSPADATANLKGVDNERFSPRVGLLYQPWRWLSLYGNFVESLGASNTAIGVGGNVLQPETAEQYEAGFKTEFFDQRLMSSVAFYDLTKQNMAVAMVGTPFSQAIGEARSRGVEVDVTGRITDDLSLIGTYAYTDAVILKGSNAGNRLWNVPRNAGSLWAKYDLQQAVMRGLSVGAGVYFQGQKEGDMTNSFELPGYGRIDALVKYQLPIAKAKTTLQFNVENLLDHRYYASTVGWSPAFVNPGQPRTFMGSVKVEF